MTYLTDYQSALDFVVRQTEKIETKVYERAYPAITYARDIPVDFSGPEYASTVSFFSADSLGAAQVINSKSDDIPMASTQRDKHSVQVEMAAIGYGFSMEEIGKAHQQGIDLSAQGAMAARKAYEMFMDTLAYMGNPGVNDGKGLYTLSAITTTAASTPWARASADNILSDVNGLLERIFNATKGQEYADTLHLPMRAYTVLASKRLSEHSDTTLLRFIQESNILKASTGQDLHIRTDHRLTNKAVIYRRDEDVLKLHVPMPLQFLAPQFQGLRFTVPGMFRTSGLEIRNPAALQELTGL